MVITMLDGVGIIVTTVVIALEVTVSVSYAVDVLSDVVIAVLAEVIGAVMIGVGPILAGARTGGLVGIVAVDMLTDANLDVLAAATTVLDVVTMLASR